MAIKKEIEIVVNSSDADNKIDKLAKSLKVADKNTDALNESLNETKSKGNVFGDVNKGLDQMGGGLGGAVKGLKATIAQMWLLVANPIGLVITAIAGALTLLYKAFASTNAGGKQIEQMFAGLGAVLDIFRDRFLILVNAFTKGIGGIVKLFKGDFKGAINDFKGGISEAKQSVRGFGAEVEAEFKQAAEATRFLQEVSDATRDLGVSRAKLNRDLARSKEIITDETASYADKKKAIDKVRIAEEKQTAQELANAEKKLKAIKTLNKLSNSTDEDKQKQADAEAELFALQERSAGNRRQLRRTELRAEKEEQSRLDGIRKEGEQKRKEANDRANANRLNNLAKIKEASNAEIQILKEKFEDEKTGFEEQRKAILENIKITADQKEKLIKEINKAEKKAIEKNNEDVLNLRNQYQQKIEDLDAKTELEKIELAERRALEELDRLENNEEAKLELIKYYAQVKNELQISEEKKKAEELLAIEKKLSDEKKELDQSVADAKFSIANNVSNLLMELAGRGSKIGKAIAVSQATISGIEGVQNAYTTAQKSPITTVFPAYPAIQAGLAGAFSAIQIKKILSTKESGGGGGGSFSSGGGGSVPQAPSFNLIQGTGRNQIAESLRSQDPLKAFVVAKDVTTGQSMDRNIINSASI